MSPAPPQIMWPDWLEARRVPETCQSLAYEQTPAAFKAAIKTAIAWHFWRHGQLPQTQSQLIHDVRSGFSQYAETCPCAWSLLICAPASGAAPITAAALLPVLAGVDSIAAIQTGPPTSAFLLAMELCGVEDLYTLPSAELPDAVASLQAALPPDGRIMILDEKLAAPDHGKDAILTLYPAMTRACALPEALPDLELISFCLGASNLASNPEQAEVIYTGQQGHKTPADLPHNCLALDKGCEGIWTFPGLGPERFRSSRARIGLVLEPCL